jgi:ribosomal protein S27AE
MSGKRKRCQHDRQAQTCPFCGGNAICEHHKQRQNCKKCGLYRPLLKGGFSSEEVKTIGAITTCQFPGCLVQAVLQANGRQLSSDHLHDGHKLNTENYRGEVCFGHNMLLSELDAHPEWANAEAREYLRRRPYGRGI